MFKVDDMVVYGTNSVCQITAIEERECGEKMVNYYILRPIHTKNSTVFVPVNNEKLTSKMRPVLTKEQIHQMLSRLSEMDVKWIEDERTRKNSFKDILNRADTFELLQTISILIKRKESMLSCGKKLHMTDERMLQDAQKMIDDEFAYVLDIDQETVAGYIQAVLVQ